MLDFNETETAILDAMHAGVQERGEDYIYSNPIPEDERESACQYVHPGNVPGCIVGVGLINSGLVGPEFFTFHEGQGARVVLREYLVHEDTRLPKVNDDFADIMDDIQGYQDGLTPWGSAFNQGLDSLSRFGYDVSRWRL